LHRAVVPVGLAAFVGLYASAIVVTPPLVDSIRSGPLLHEMPYVAGVLLVGLGVSLFFLRVRLGAWLARDARWPWLLGLAWLLVFAGFYGAAFVLTPTAAANIFEQQYQMHRFATGFWRRPIAVNDLGWVSYENPDYVLDLFGLGLDAAREAYGRKDTNWMANAATERHVGLAMIYKDWFRGFLPAQWTEVARLHMESARVTPDKATVDIYLLDPALRGRAEAALRDFGATLPKGATLELLPATGRGEVTGVSD